MKLELCLFNPVCMFYVICVYLQMHHIMSSLQEGAGHNTQIIRVSGE